MPSTTNQHETIPASLVPDERPSVKHVTSNDERPPSAESENITKCSLSEMESTPQELLNSSEFHSSSEERQLSLMRRKQEFLQTARR